jgi:hypothetical protein
MDRNADILSMVKDAIGFIKIEYDDKECSSDESSCSSTSSCDSD